MNRDPDWPLAPMEMHGFRDTEVSACNEMSCFSVTEVKLPGGLMDDLIQQAKACELCLGDLPLGVRPVFQAHPSARILIAGQAPGRRVHESGIPFDDPSGDRLRRWLGVNRATFYDPTCFAILPMGFCYPGSGKSGDLPPVKRCATEWRARFLDGLSSVRLTILLGRFALQWHLGGRFGGNLTETVLQWRSLLPDYLALPHPSPRNNIWLKRNPWFQTDVIPNLQRLVASILDPNGGWLTHGIADH